jgi:uncharacterized small protein (DUF1192 family)
MGKKKKKKKKKPQTPRRKRMNRSARLQNARATRWVENYSGKDLVRGYRRWYGVDAQAAASELQMLGVSNLKERAEKIRKETAKRAQANALRKQQRRSEGEDLFCERDETFAFIAGHTSGGAPYGVTWDEWRRVEGEPPHAAEIAHRQPGTSLDDVREIPF